jgi:hypothetical protein
VGWGIQLKLVQIGFEKNWGFAGASGRSPAQPEDIPQRIKLVFFS